MRGSCPVLAEVLTQAHGTVHRFIHRLRNVLQPVLVVKAFDSCGLLSEDRIRPGSVVRVKHVARIVIFCLRQQVVELDRIAHMRVLAALERLQLHARLVDLCDWLHLGLAAAASTAEHYAPYESEEEQEGYKAAYRHPDNEVSLLIRPDNELLVPRVVVA